MRHERTRRRWRGARRRRPNLVLAWRALRNGAVCRSFWCTRRCAVAGAVMTAFWHCWPKVHAAPASHVHRVRHTRRIGRSVKRAGGIAISKPAIIGWTCLAVGALIPSLLVAPAALPAAVAARTGPVETSPWAGIDMLPPTNEWPDIGPTLLLPDMPLVPDVPITQPVQPVSEPSSLALLVTALVAFAVWRRR